MSSWDELKHAVECDVKVESLPNRPEMGECVRKAALAMKLGDFAAANRVLSDGIARGGGQEGDHILLDLRAACALHARLPQQALGDALQCTQAAPGWARGWARLGEAQLCLGHAGAAQSAYAEGLRLDPASHELRAGLALAERATAAQGGRRQAQHHG